MPTLLPWRRLSPLDPLPSPHAPLPRSVTAPDGLGGRVQRRMVPPRRTQRPRPRTSPGPQCRRPLPERPARRGLAPGCSYAASRHAQEPGGPAPAGRPEHRRVADAAPRPRDDEQGPEVLRRPHLWVARRMTRLLPVDPHPFPRDPPRPFPRDSPRPLPRDFPKPFPYSPSRPPYTSPKPPPLMARHLRGHSDVRYLPDLQYHPGCLLPRDPPTMSRDDLPPLAVMMRVLSKEPFVG